MGIAYLCKITEPFVSFDRFFRFNILPCRYEYSITRIKNSYKGILLSSIIQYWNIIKHLISVHSKTFEVSFRYIYFNFISLLFRDGYDKISGSDLKLVNL
ncbi:unnamed protein product [Spodoptera littoralis]|uniref:Uncharacterized protein n=1 Tax=Spodoptera littoralis TaxID=7109 RepID=A0A9P0N760_SPOLI|nr:unnamed protein product [Spodoptera littoralis]CAH1644898.1 unnamed protein product [Spodoptera littoralis]